MMSDRELIKRVVRRAAKVKTLEELAKGAEKAMIRVQKLRTTLIDLSADIGWAYGKADDRKDPVAPKLREAFDTVLEAEKKTDGLQDRFRDLARDLRRESKSSRF